ncbi:MAG: hypothetical protein ABJO57_10120 [Lentilitoribacter sp.]
MFNRIIEENEAQRIDAEFEAKFPQSENSIKSSHIKEADQNGKEANFNLTRIADWYSRIFLRNREKMDRKIFQLRSLLSYINTKITISEIKYLRGYEENRKVFLKTKHLENILLNSIITERYVKNKDSLKKLDENDNIDPLVKLYIAQFYAIKNMECDKQGKDQIGIPISNKEICRRGLLETITATAQEAFSVACDNEIERQQFIEEVLDALQERTFKIAPPAKAPEFYSKRKNRKEKPDEFIRRVYSRWLGTESFQRPLLKSLDISLYRGLYKQGIPDDFETLLPSAQGKSPKYIHRTDSEKLRAIQLSQKKANNKRRKKNVISNG